MKKRIKMASVMEDDRMSPIGGSSKKAMVSSKDSKIGWIAKRKYLYQDLLI
jgi:hypothetical protein